MTNRINDAYFSKAYFLKSAARVNQLPPDEGYEVAFAGRSNAGKSTALNCLTHHKQLARTSKTPGRTQLMNLFALDDERRLVDLPGYGYAEVPLAIKNEWQRHLSHYLNVRVCLRGLVLLMDCRHPLKEGDEMMIDWALNRELPVHILLTKADKISKSQANLALKTVEKRYELLKDDLITVQLFSAVRKQGLDILIKKLRQWYAL